METYKYINKSWAQNAVSEVMQPWCERLQKALPLAEWEEKKREKKKKDDVFTDTGQIVYIENRFYISHFVVSEGIWVVYCFKWWLAVCQTTIMHFL